MAVEAMMGCFCRELLPRSAKKAEPWEEPPEEEQEGKEQRALVRAVSEWCAARWLPAPRWEPDPAWLEVAMPEPPVPQAALSVLLALLNARTACTTALQLDLLQPGAPLRLARVVATLNRRVEELEDELAQDARPWAAVSMRLYQAETVQAAAQAVRAQTQPELSTPWRRVAGRVKQLVPLVSIGTVAGVDLGEEGAAERLAATVSQLRRIELPDLVSPVVVLRLLERVDAVGRLRQGLGLDPLETPFHQVEQAVRRREQAAAAAVPEAQLVDGELVGLPQTPINPSVLLNPAVLQAVKRLNPAVVQRLRWQVPTFEELPLLRAGAPALALVGALTSIGKNPVAQRPCGTCDAGAVMRELQAVRG